ncbi:DUF2235 domain-containing protein [Massilia sp. Leaf139]|uniref:T6SS phospholipase effector Tle1-like catalytic domain-containing protein n=1 Tax=Massilia sp. Leaf139 TaxID=1736272 RepID=UPI000A9ECB99|nr:DUF2235 domain-containing protein [Massilia sp. Leaf139]
MTKNQNSGRVGDSKALPLQPNEKALRTASEQAAHIDTIPAEPIVKIRPLESVSAAVTVKSSPDNRATCKQCLWFSFFFDGTGNNLFADKNVPKHSNVAKLYRVHSANDPVNGIYAMYLQGVGTYFREIGDDGGSALGLGTGSMGQERLDYALKQFDSYLLPHLNRAQASSSASIVEINIAVFGFSRGAALARAFLSMLLEERCKKEKGKWVSKQGQWPIRLRFAGLFDTVASVGLPMSSNTTSKVGVAMSSVEYMMEDRLENYRKTRPEALAFSEDAAPGADPAPGKYDGHAGWGGKMEIDYAVEEVRDFIAAHEIRNSFPVDSISIFQSKKITKPRHFYETVYPGVHSDVGGSYAPGEGARSELRTEGLGLIPLTQMYRHAVSCGVPLLPAISWGVENKEDFEISKDLIACFNHYLKKVGSVATIGTTMNRHMALYYAWRFRSIRLKLAGNTEEATRISKHRNIFAHDEKRIDDEIWRLEKEEARAAKELDSLISRRSSATMNARSGGSIAPQSGVSNEDIQAARERKLSVHHDLLSAKARKLAQPKMDQLQNMLSIYDAQLINDVMAIRRARTKKHIFGDEVEHKNFKNLRPHYKSLIEAYENEFERNKGITDPNIISFFDNYVHDSLAGFAGDATLPSDPRVVYLGGDNKYEYAFHPGNFESHEKAKGTC